MLSDEQMSNWLAIFPTNWRANEQLVGGGSQYPVIVYLDEYDEFPGETVGETEPILWKKPQKRALHSSQHPGHFPNGS